MKDKNKNTLYTEIHEDHIPCSFPYKVVCINDKFRKQPVPYREKNADKKLIDALLEEYDYCKKVLKR